MAATNYAYITVEMNPPNNTPTGYFLVAVSGNPEDALKDLQMGNPLTLSISNQYQVAQSVTDPESAAIAAINNLPTSNPGLQNYPAACVNRQGWFQYNPNDTAHNPMTIVYTAVSNAVTKAQLSSSKPFDAGKSGKY